MKMEQKFALAEKTLSCIPDCVIKCGQQVLGIDNSCLADTCETASVVLQLSFGLLVIRKMLSRCN